MTTRSRRTSAGGRRRIRTAQPSHTAAGAVGGIEVVHWLGAEPSGWPSRPRGRPPASLSHLPVRCSLAAALNSCSSGCECLWSGDQFIARKGMIWKSSVWERCTFRCPSTGGKSTCSALLASCGMPQRPLPSLTVPGVSVRASLVRAACASVLHRVAATDASTRRPIRRRASGMPLLCRRYGVRGEVLTCVAVVWPWCGVDKMTRWSGAAGGRRLCHAVCDGLVLRHANSGMGFASAPPAPGRCR